MTHFETLKESSPQVKAVLHYLDQIKVLNLHEIEKLFTDDFVQSTRPLSLGIPSRTKEEDLKFLQGLADQLGGRPIEITIYDIIESPGKAWAHLHMHGEPQEGKPFDVECIYQFRFAENYRFKALIDFVDSKALADVSKFVDDPGASFSISDPITSFGTFATGVLHEGIIANEK
ncbi:hypothetical protein H4582DRAFT_2097074 [Lactarius indigo]|nr:hypothetical protein H4582DRAFT_2097074 [Lactarius indigo]